MSSSDYPPLTPEELARQLANERANVAVLVEALQPFARAAQAIDAIDPGFPDEGAALRASFDFWVKNADGERRESVRMRDFRKALAALSSVEGGR